MNRFNLNSVVFIFVASSLVIGLTGGCKPNVVRSLAGRWEGKIDMHPNQLAVIRKKITDPRERKNFEDFVSAAQSFRLLLDIQPNGRYTLNLPGRVIQGYWDYQQGESTNAYLIVEAINGEPLPPPSKDQEGNPNYGVEQLRVAPDFSLLDLHLYDMEDFPFKMTLKKVD